jgi:predicted homoserine dehydrogenase-like protein
VPKLGLVTEVFGAAKRPLKAGETIDGAGGASVYALNDLYETVKAENVVPLGLLRGAKLRCHVPTDKPVTYDMVDVIDITTLYHLRAMQGAGGAGKFKAAVRDMDGRPKEPQKVAAE